MTCSNGCVFAISVFEFEDTVGRVQAVFSLARHQEPCKHTKCRLDDLCEKRNVHRRG